MKKIMLMVVAMLMLVSPVAAAEQGGTTDAGAAFKDVPAAHWAKAQIEQAVEKGYVSGFPDGTFKPEEKVSRAQFFRMLTDGLKLPHVEQGDPWYQPYVAALIETGIHKEKDFKSEYGKNLSRLEMVKLAVRAVTPGIDNNTDSSDDNWLVYKGTETGILAGVGGGKLDLEGTSTRAQAVAIVERVLAVAAGKKLPVDEAALKTAKYAAFHHNLDEFGFTDIVKLPVTVADESGFKVTINSIFAYNREDSKPIVDKYELTELRNVGEKIKAVPQYDLEGYQDDYTLFLLNITIANDGKKEQAYDFYDLDIDYSLISHQGSFPITAPGYLSQFRKGSNRTDYTYDYRVKQGESFTTNQAVIFKRGYVAEFLNFSVLNSFITIAKIPSDKAR